MYETTRRITQKRTRKTMNEIFANFQKYNEKGQRMNIFCEVHEDGLIVTYFPCSKYDQFSKHTGWKLYTEFKGGDLSNLHKWSCRTISVVDNKPKKTFLNWCNDNFYHLRDRTVRYNRFFLENKHGKRIILKDKPMFDKMSMY